MIKFILTIFIFISCFVRLDAGSIKGLVLGDTGCQIGPQVAKDMREMQRYFETIGQFYQMPVKIERVENNLSLGLKKFEKLQIQSDDILVFYYMGHGFRSHDKQSDLPFLFILSTGEVLDFDDFVEVAEYKKAKLSLLITDSCNKIFSKEALAEKREIYVPFMGNKTVLTAQRSLFQEKGVFVFCSSSPHEKAWASSKGGYFTLAFLDLLAEYEFSSFKDLETELIRQLHPHQTPLLIKVE